MTLSSRRAKLAPIHTVSWAVAALDDIEEIERYAAQDKPVAAARLLARPVARADSLAWSPHRGVRVRGRLHKLLVHAPYVIRYVIDPFEVTIVSVRREPSRRPQRRR